MASIIIPAHNEAAVIDRTLQRLVDGLDPSNEVVVVCNGCTDATADLARGLGPAITVIEIAEASKTSAIRAGERMATGFPVVVQDADVVVSGESMTRIIEALSAEGALAAEPIPTFDLTTCTYPVRAFYRVWLALHGGRPGDVGGGVYGLSEAGRGRFPVIPDVIGDDAFVRAHFSPGEIVAVDGAVSSVRPPSTIGSLVDVRARTRLGQWELAARYPELWSKKRVEGDPLSVKGRRLTTRQWLETPIYLYVQVVSRFKAVRLMRRHPSERWLRDESARS